MNYFVVEERCDCCQLCISACPNGAVASTRETPLHSEPTSTGEPGTPIIMQDECDGCEAELVPPCIDVCDLDAIHVNMLV